MALPLVHGSRTTKSTGGMGALRPNCHVTFVRHTLHKHGNAIRVPGERGPLPAKNGPRKSARKSPPFHNPGCLGNRLSKPYRHPSTHDRQTRNCAAPRIRSQPNEKPVTSLNSITSIHLAPPALPASRTTPKPGASPPESPAGRHPSSPETVENAKFQQSKLQKLRRSIATNGK